MISMALQAAQRGTTTKTHLIRQIIAGEKVNMNKAVYVIITEEEDTFCDGLVTHLNSGETQAQKKPHVQTL